MPTGFSPQSLRSYCFASYSLSKPEREIFPAVDCGAFVMLVSGLPLWPAFVESIQVGQFGVVAFFWPLDVPAGWMSPINALDKLAKDPDPMEGTKRFVACINDITVFSVGTWTWQNKRFQLLKHVQHCAKLTHTIFSKWRILSCRSEDSDSRISSKLLS